MIQINLDLKVPLIPYKKLEPGTGDLRLPLRVSDPVGLGGSV